MRFLELSHRVEHGMVTYKGLPGPVITDQLSREASRERYDGGDEFQIGKIEMVANTGTYVDSPFHRFAGGIDVSELSLARLADLEGVVVRRPFGDGLAVDADAFSGLDPHGKAVLIATGWDRHWRTEAYYENHPFLTAEAARVLADGGATLVGIDSHNIDDTRERRRPVHTALLGAGIPICEHLCRLDQLPNSGFRFFAVPAPIKGLGTFPVRAFGIV